MTEWIVRRWARYGHERLYAETPRGTSLGYLDVKTGRLHSEEPSNLPLLEKAIGDHVATNQVTVRAVPAAIPTPAPVVSLMTTPAEQPHEIAPPAWEDLSATPPGAAARARAEAEREEQGWLRHGLARVVGARTDERAWRIGADGEQAVAAQLAKLGLNWHVIHAIPVGERGSDIDHIVMGPGGVFTVNAKHLPDASVWVGGDAFLVNGRRVPYVRNSRHEADRASRLLTRQAGFPVDVVGVLAVMGARKGFMVKKQPEDGRVVVVKRRRVSQEMLARPARLSLREVDAIFQVAKRSTTWC
ncbi:nuclease-related domain-containing protein [Ornithinimicrobium cryptoxanthini]|uniref:nuclease-related domain-containing protein n=1 Tax=Ornithinimicrobium cryptoxanthini TaxID=2934161 RepID=UPI002118AAD3|nr:nuclease-related domain-containing protein [Ornithinimicrobium cryptoxanthini]